MTLVEGEANFWVFFFSDGVGYQRAEKKNVIWT